MILLAQATAAATDFTAGQTVFFWVAAVLMVALALGVTLEEAMLEGAVAVVVTGAWVGVSVVVSAFAATGTSVNVPASADAIAKRP